MPVSVLISLCPFSEVDRLLVLLVDTNNHMPDTERVRQRDVLTSLAVLQDARNKIARQTQQQGHQHPLLRSRGHVLDEVTVALIVDDREVELVRLKLPRRDVSRDTTRTLSLQVVKDPHVLERALAELP